MRRYLIAFLLISAFLLSFSVSLNEIAEKLVDLNYKAERVFIEKPKAGAVKMRLETVYKWGENKIVFIMAPEEVTWVRKEDEYWLGNDVLLYSPVDLKDLEDITLEELLSAPQVAIKEEQGNHLITFVTDKGKFELVLDEDFRPLRIVRSILGIKMEMEYREYFEDLPSMEEILAKLKLSDELAFPKEIGDVLMLLDWFTLFKEDNVIHIKGIFKGTFVDISISSQPFPGSLKYGNIYIKTENKDIMKNLGLK